MALYILETSFYILIFTTINLQLFEFKKEARYDDKGKENISILLMNDKTNFRFYKRNIWKVYAYCIAFKYLFLITSID